MAEPVKMPDLYDYNQPRIEEYHSGDGKWSGADKSLATLYLIMQALDYNQTRSFLRRPEQFEEGNPLLGKHPSQAKLAGANILTAAGVLKLADKLPPAYRKILLGGATAVEGQMVNAGHRVGVDAVRY